MKDTLSSRENLLLLFYSLDIDLKPNPLALNAKQTHSDKNVKVQIPLFQIQPWLNR